jgi:hypothetical protein
MAPVLAITGMVATDVEYDNSFDPVGETLKPIALTPKDGTCLGYFVRIHIANPLS